MSAKIFWLSDYVTDVNYVDRCHRLYDMLSAEEKAYFASLPPCAPTSPAAAEKSGLGLSFSIGLGLNDFAIIAGSLFGLVIGASFLRLIARIDARGKRGIMV